MGLWFNVETNFTINSSLTQATYNQQHSVADDSRLHGRGRGISVFGWCLQTRSSCRRFGDPHCFASFSFEVLWTISWYSYSGTYILDAEELREKAVLLLYLETCGVRKWGKTKENVGAGYVASTCCMA